MTGTQVWQAMPQGWIEFVAHGDSTQESWWDDYLRSGDGWLPDEAREGLTAGYRAGCSFFRGKDFDFAGIAIALQEKPFVSIMCTKVVRDEGSDAGTRAYGIHALLPALRFGEDAVSEPFQADDGRTGSVTTAVVSEQGEEVTVSLGEISLPDEGGNVIVFGVCTDPARREFLALHTAFALSTTRLLPVGTYPEPPAGNETAESAA